MPVSSLLLLRWWWRLVCFDQRLDGKDTLDESLDGRADAFFQCRVYGSIAVKRAGPDVFQIAPEHRSRAHERSTYVFLNTGKHLRSRERADFLPKLRKEREELLPVAGAS
jgi:hypothetical protein